MWIFRKNRGHISPETLSEYIDGRLSPGERGKVERHLEGCSGCRAEVESLSYTVSLLRRMPERSPRRVFTLAEAPPLASTPWRVRVPVWAYGAAASVFVALFALVLSADLSGSLAGDGSGFSIPDQEQASPPVSQQSELMSDPEAEKSLAVSTPTATPAPQPTAMLMMEAAPAVTPASQTIAASRTDTPIPQPASVPETAAMEAAPASTATPQAAAMSGETAAMSDDGPAPMDEQVAKEVASSVSTPPSAVTPLPTPTAPTVVASPTVARRTDGFQQATTPVPTATPAPSPTPVPAPTIPLGEGQPAPTPETLAQEVSYVEAEDSSTSIVWRVLEVVLGAAAVVLVGGILWRVRYRRGRTIS